MKTILNTLITFLYITVLSSQNIDSIKVVESDNGYNAIVYGYNHSTGASITNIKHSISADSISINLYYYIHCTGFDEIIPFDTTLNLGILQPSDYLVTCRTIKAISLDSTVCPPNYSLIFLDSLTIPFKINSTSSNELHENRLKVYPTLFKDYINIKFDLFQTQRQELNIINLNGELVRSLYLSEIQSKINLSDLKPGIYFLSTNNSHLQKEFAKIIKL